MRRLLSEGRTSQRPIVLVLVACLLGVLDTKCHAQPQNQQLKEQVLNDNSDGRSSEAKPSVARAVMGPAEMPADRENHVGPGLLQNIIQDQAAIWSSPRHLHFVDVDWLAPLALATGGMLATDTEYSKHLSNSPRQLNRSNDLSNIGLGSLVGITGGLYLRGHTTSDDHAEESGILAGETTLDSLAVTYTLQNVFGRQHPLENDYRGDFWHGGHSFPSAHAAAAWSLASIIAHEYPGPLTSLFTYGLAAGVSATRVDAKQHFNSDVLVGSTIGWLVGQQVYRQRHNPILGGGEWETYAERQDKVDSAKDKGSPYVPLDSWVYPVLERLAALGYIKTEFLGMRPWTRSECAELTEEAGDSIRGQQSDTSEIVQLYNALQREFGISSETTRKETQPFFHVESLYAGATEIVGPPLNDSYHFGQTIINNQGQPSEQGFNQVSGFSGWSTAGRFAIYTRGEFQHAPSAPGYSASLEDLIATLDGTPVRAAGPVPATNQFRLLDTYVAANVAGWDLAFGKQSLWWGPAQGSAFLFSDNAEPIYMFRASRMAPFVLPWIFRWLGPMKWDLFFGKLSGNVFPPRPLIHGEKISFKPTENLELGFSRTVEMGGVGRALTFGHLALSYFSVSSPLDRTPNNDPGKRNGGFDLTYRVPLARNWLTFYLDSLADDDPSPLASPRRAGINPGLYLTRFPKLARLDLRVEGVNTNTPSSSNGGHFIYFDTFYRQLYTNKNNLIGSWIGREGTGIQAWSTYWFSPKRTLQFGYRHAKVTHDFIPRGETLNDGSVKADWWVRNNLGLYAFLQYEKWLAPVLAPIARSNWTSSIGISFQPHGLNLHLRREHSPEPENWSSGQ